MRDRKGDAWAHWVGPACAAFGTLGFSFKAILIKLAYAAAPVDAITLLALRMLYSAPFFIAMAWWAGRGAAPIGRRDWLAISGLGFIGYYLASLLDFMGLRYVTASLERLVLYLYPTMVVLLSAMFLGKPVTRRA
ncbi:MAG: DMT family transporter, partial [Vicinamibacteria bacterium]